EDQLSSSDKYSGKIGAFEGATYEAKGYYRPQENCIMFTRHDAFSPCAGERLSASSRCTRDEELLQSRLRMLTIEPCQSRRQPRYLPGAPSSW
ncbi:MAG: M64 family metallopeptidase, partial [Terriglobales bacterium]